MSGSTEQKPSGSTSPIITSLMAHRCASNRWSKGISAASWAIWSWCPLFQYQDFQLKGLSQSLVVFPSHLVSGLMNVCDPSLLDMPMTCCRWKLSWSVTYLLLPPGSIWLGISILNGIGAYGFEGHDPSACALCEFRTGALADPSMHVWSERAVPDPGTPSIRVASDLCPRPKLCDCYNMVRTPTLWLPDTSDRPVYFPFNLLNLAMPL